MILGCSDDPSSWPFALQSTVFPGSHRLRGTISLAPGGQSSGAAALTLTSVDTLSPYTTLAYVDEASIHDLGRISGSIDYTISGLAAGSYVVGCLVNHDGDQEPSAGDLGGYYDGTPEEPLLSGSTARVIEVDQSIDGLDFGIGPVTCLAGYGEQCSEDADCGGTLCSYPETERVRGLHAGTCDLESGLCVEAPGECPTLDGTDGTKSESGCFGAGPE